MAAISLAQKVEIASLLARAGVRELEVSGPFGMAEGVRVAKAIQSAGIPVNLSAVVVARSPVWHEDIVRAKDAGFDHVEFVLPTSTVRLAHLAISESEVPGIVQRAYDAAAEVGVRYGLGLGDATRADLSFLRRLAERARVSGAVRVTLYDTVGVGRPFWVAPMVEEIVGTAAPLDVFIHCHNDLGMAVANTLTALEAGAAGADVTVGGIGDRAGNAALEQVVIGLQVLLGIDTGVDSSQLREVCSAVDAILGVSQDQLRPIVGPWCFHHVSPSHVAEIARGNSSAFEAFSPDLVRATRMFGFTLPADYSHAIKAFADKLGIVLDDDDLDSIDMQLRLRGAEGVNESEILEILQAGAEGRRKAE